MSRSGYSDGIDNWALIKWRGQVMSAIRGKRGQHFLRELILSLEEMPKKRLIKNELEDENGEVCALGALGAKKGINLKRMDPEDNEFLATEFNIASQLVQEVAFLNDEVRCHETPEERWDRLYAWAKENLRREDGSGTL